MSDDEILHAEYGPCPNCFQPLDLVAEDRQAPCFSLLFFARFNWNEHAQEKQVYCCHCGFTTDMISYEAYQNQSMVIVVSKSSETSTTASDEISVLSNTTGLPNEGIYNEPSHGEEYESLAGLLISEKYYSECCRSCRASLSRNWRFCPNCGIFIEDTSSTAFSTDDSMHRSDSEESFEHLLISDQPQKQLYNTWIGTRMRPVRSQDKSQYCGTTQAIFRSNEFQPIR